MEGHQGATVCDQGLAVDHHLSAAHGGRIEQALHPFAGWAGCHHGGAGFPLQGLHQPVDPGSKRVAPTALGPGWVRPLQRCRLDRDGEPVAAALIEGLKALQGRTSCCLRRGEVLKKDLLQAVAEGRLRSVEQSFLQCLPSFLEIVRRGFHRIEPGGAHRPQ